MSKGNITFSSMSLPPPNMGQTPLKPCTQTHQIWRQALKLGGVSMLILRAKSRANFAMPGMLEKRPKKLRVHVLGVRILQLKV